MEKQRRRQNLPAQERVVTALWAFARAQQDPSVPKTSSSEGWDGFITHVNLDAVGTAKAEIMEAFGYDVTHLE